ncbi:uncharacterized protein FIBRA_02670 [Fibroporia radiculosa]|uniref:DUF6593 domain-containing protein n=1 Tax=Fibroporia radiculosa TaxID=599839 RepID=J4G2A1_9APHY|nr:uncharacterized protein FIBRA_02670 [Fibroporia radiculosa]CCM00633.1 predicted protein [Fibroporia radiculosa]
MIIDPHDVSDPFSDDLSAVEHLPDYASETATISSSSRPPRYIHIERPTQPLIYSFVSWNSSSMMLVPPRTIDPGRGAIYFISVKLDLKPFAPLSYITSVHRGSDENGELVGEFELGITHTRATVTIGHYATRLKNVLQHDGRSSRKFTWRHGSIDLRWNCSTTLDDGSPMCICSDSASHQLASFVPPPLDASPPLPEATLTVFPDGHRLFDHILLSALVVERKMTLSG